MVCDCRNAIEVEAIPTPSSLVSGAPLPSAGGEERVLSSPT